MNRWLLFQGHGNQLIPFPGSVDPLGWKTLVSDVGDAVRAATGQYMFSDGAKAVYTDFYRDVHTGRLGGLGTTEATTRVDAHATKLGLLDAVLAKHREIEREDIESGIAVATYCARVVEPIAQRLGTRPEADLEARVLGALKMGPLSKRDIYRTLHLTAHEAWSAIKGLVDVGSIRPVGGQFELVP